MYAWLIFVAQFATLCGFNVYWLGARQDFYEHLK